MAETKSNKLISWLLTRPLIFALTTMLFMVVSILVLGVTASIWPDLEKLPYILMTILMTLTLFTATAILVRGLPPQNLDRRSFVAITNAQTLVASVAFIALILLIAPIAPEIMPHMLQQPKSPSFISIIASGLLLLYLCGVHIAGLYAKYRRIRAMGVSMWRIICTAPFGFAMLWIPGYLLPAPTPKAPSLNLHNSRYARLTDWIIARPTNAAACFVILILLSNLLFGFNTILFLLAIAGAFSIWVMITGTHKFRTNIAGAYTWTAIGLNIISWIVVICIAIYSAHNKTPANITLDGTEPTLEITQ